jgi:diadenosine tetraphosphate (Ap4A) HIT family hydrolase
MSEKYLSIIHERVAMANNGENITVIKKLESGWVVLGDNQIIPGYCLLLSDPVVESINILDDKKRKQFLMDMAIIGDALLKALNADLINYMILGNLDRYLHAHIHPRYESEKDEYRKKPPFIYNFNNEPIIQFEYEKHKEIMEKIKYELNKLME